MTKPPRQKKCKSCGEEFAVIRPLQSVCGPSCAFNLAVAKRMADAEKSRRAVKKSALEKIKTRGDYLKECQQAFNAWIRERDYAEPCISCGTTKPVQYCAGHYLTVGAHPELRFEPLNVHKQCNKNCNLEKSGNIVEYRKRLIAKIGTENVEWLEGNHEPKKYTIDEIKQLTAHYRAEAKRLKLRNQGQT